MNNRDIFRKLGDFVLGKGFYIVLFLCVATIGISGYYLIRTMTDRPGTSQPAGGDASVVLPDDQVPDPSPVPGPQQDQDEDDGGAQAPDSSVSQPDDPEPVKQGTEAETQAPDPLPPEEASYIWPVQGELLRGFSLEVLSPDPTLADWRTHGGLDIAADLGTQVLAMEGGTVTRVYDDGLMGTTVVVDHGNGLVTTYCGLAAPAAVEEGQAVAQGGILGAVGDTAIAEGGMPSHLHLEAVLDDQQVDPLDFLPEAS